MSFALLGRMISRSAGVALMAPNYPLMLANAGSLARSRVGGMIDAAGMAGTMVLAEAGGTLMTPYPESAIVDGYGHIEDGGFNIHRFYMAGMTLQVITGPDRMVCTGEIKLFQKLAEINPATPEEWQLWTESVSGGQPLLTSPTLLWQNNVEYARVWSPGNGPAGAKHYVERLDVGRQGEFETTTISAMLFSRKLDGGMTEWLQLAICRCGSERWIEAYVGLSAELGELTAV